MDGSFTLLIKEAIDLELNLADLYLLYYNYFPDDSQFWWALAVEEQNHAAILKTVLQMISSNVDIPREFLPARIEELVMANGRIKDFNEGFERNPDRTRAFQFAFATENSAGELHYNTFMKSEDDSHIASVFKTLNGDDMNHAERIRQYMIDHQIPHE